MMCLWAQITESQAKFNTPLLLKPAKQRIEVSKSKAMETAKKNLEDARKNASTSCLQWKKDLSADASFEQVLAVAEQAGLLKESAATEVNTAKKGLTEACLSSLGSRV
eukprot:599589-Amphidinium_carterae.3